MRALHRLGAKEMRLHAPGLSRPVVVRLGDSDIYDFEHSLGSGREPLDLGFTPRVIVDAGANVGYSVLRFFLEFPTAHIIAIEPDAENLEQLKKNCADYGNLTVIPCGLWPHKARLKIANPEAGSNAFTVAEDPNGTIPTTSIGDLLKEYSLASIDLLKVDIEGSEIEVFSDCEEWVPMVRALLVETHDDMRAGCSQAVRDAVSEHMSYQGQVGEYDFYLAGNDDRRPADK